MNSKFNYIFLLLLNFCLLTYSVNYAQISKSKSVFAAPVSFDRVDLSEFISNEFVTCIGQDSCGFMWFGTNEGLCRYDGKIVKVYKSIKGDPTSLKSNTIQYIYSDSNGNLWIAADGLHRYNFEKDNFIRIEPPVYDSMTLKINFVNALCEDNLGQLWIGTFGQGLYKFNPVSGKINFIKLEGCNPFPFKSYLISSLSFDGKDLIWAAVYQNSIVSINTRSKEQHHYQFEPKGGIQKIISDKLGRLWFASDNNPLKLVSVKGNNIVVSESFENTRPKNYFAKIIGDHNGNFWMSTQSDGVVVFNLLTKEVENFRYNSRAVHSISGDDVEDVFEDNSGNIWIATNKGICKWSKWKKPFHHFQYDTENPNSISSSEVTGIDKDKEGNLWISNLNTGFCKLNLNTGKFTRYNPSTSKIKSPWALEILAANDGTIWVATNFQHGLNHFNPAAGTFKEYLNNPKDETSLGTSLVTFLYQDKQNRIWIGCAGNGLNLYNPSKDNFIRFKNNPSDENSLSGNDVRSIYQENNSVLWIGTNNGINEFDLDSQSFKNYLPQKSLNDTSDSFDVFSICEGTGKDLWLGTSKGLYLFNTETKSFLQMPQISELRDGRIFGVLKDNSGNLWLQTISALVKYQPEKKAYRIYDKKNGWIQSSIFTREWIGSYKKLKSGDMVFGGSNGITIFNPGDITDNTGKPPVYITGFSLFNTPIEANRNPLGKRKNQDSILTKSVIFTNKIVLNHDENSFTFNFTSLDYTNPAANQFAYKLDGFDKDWTNSGSINSAAFTNIPPGEYTFLVKASNSDGFWNEKGASIRLIILPPWWKTTSAYIGYVIFLLVVLYSFRRFELNRIRTRNQLRMKEFETTKLHEIDRMKSRFFANISHEFRTPLTLILGILDKRLKKTEEDKSDFKIMKKNAERSLQLINQMLELSRLEAGTVKIKVQKTDIIRFIRRIASSFVSLPDQKRTDITLNNLSLKSDEIIEPVFLYFDYEKMETAIYNLLSNALKFTPEGEKISFKITVKETTVEISVTNTGVVIPEDELPYVFDRFYQGDANYNKNFEGTGIGLALVKELVEMHHGEVIVSSKDSQTTFTITLLQGKSHYSEQQVSEVSEENFESETEVTRIADEFIKEKESVNRKELKKESRIILVVEDHFDLRNFICEQFVRKDSSEENDYSIIEAEDGQKGYQLAEEIIPDLIISDIMMPKMDGYQLCREIKNNFKTNHIPVILLTAKAALENKLEGLETGADDYLIKPFNTDELKTRVKNLIHLREQMREKFRSEMILKPAEVIVPSNHKIFIDKFIDIIEKYMEDDHFNVEVLSNEIGMSRSQLHRKLKALTNQSPNEFIRNFRLQRAADLIKQDAGNMAEIAYKVGFSSQAYFTKLFQENFGVTPTDFKKQSNKSEDHQTP